MLVAEPGHDSGHIHRRRLELEGSWWEGAPGRVSLI